jgi:hypothetical protein
MKNKLYTSNDFKLRFALEAVLQGKSNKEIAVLLNIEVNMEFILK